MSQKDRQTHVLGGRYALNVERYSYTKSYPRVPGMCLPRSRLLKVLVPQQSFQSSLKPSCSGY